MTDKGLILTPRETGGWMLGGAGIPRYVTEILEPEGNWEKYLPKPERQKKGVETMACTVFATLNVCEMLIKRKYNLDVNFSDRWLAWASGIKPNGANPHDIAETLRKAGVPNQEAWDFTDEKTWEEFYSVPPTKLYALARAFLDAWSFKHYYVPQDGIEDALKFSPLGISVFAWADDNGVHQQYGRDNHWTTLYSKGEHYRVFDSYDSFKKLYTKDAKISIVKGYYIGKSVHKNWLLDLLRGLRRGR